MSTILTIIILALFAYVAASRGKLTASAAVTAWIVSVTIFIGAGYAGISFLAAFFILGTSATSIGIREKQRLGLAEKEKGKRTAGQVIANAGVAGILSLIMVFLKEEKSLLLLMIAASFASATADTLSSELGNIYGRNYYNIITFKRDQRGLDGVISVEGTSIGIAGSAVIAALYCLFTGWSNSFWLIVMCGTIGNLSDSVLGATLERKNIIRNNAVNFLNTLIAAIAILVFIFIRQKMLK